MSTELLAVTEIIGAKHPVRLGGLTDALKDLGVDVHPKQISVRGLVLGGLPTKPEIIFARRAAYRVYVGRALAERRAVGGPEAPARGMPGLPPPGRCCRSTAISCPLISVAPFRTTIRRAPTPNSTSARRSGHMDVDSLHVADSRHVRQPQHAAASLGQENHVHSLRGSMSPARRCGCRDATVPVAKPH